MAYIKLDQEKCKGCMLCISVCPKGQLKPAGSGLPPDRQSHKEEAALNKKGIKPVIFLAEDCTGCALCAIICPDTAIEVYR